MSDPSVSTFDLCLNMPAHVLVLRLTGGTQSSVSEIICSTGKRGRIRDDDEMASHCAVGPAMQVMRLLSSDLTQADLVDLIACKGSTGLI
eukprot:scaffold96741_cov38-Prasinocladus_malaysianus.AAC.1